MRAYNYPIIIKREPKKVRYSREIKFENNGDLTLAILRKYVNDDERFTIEDSEGGGHYILDISGERIETEEEVNIRVAKEESYMEEYNKRNNIIN